MKLYIKPGACSLAPHIALHEAKLPFELITVDLAAKKLPGGGDFFTVNPKGQVPTFALDNGEILTEVAVILQYVADQAPAAQLIPAAGTLERYKTLEWTNFVATELHKSFSPLFRPTTPEEYKPVAKDFLAGKFAFLDKRLGSVPYLAGEQYSVADIYCYVMLRWAARVGIDLSGRSNIEAYAGRLAERAAVREALAAEGLA